MHNYWKQNLLLIITLLVGCNPQERDGGADDVIDTANPWSRVAEIVDNQPIIEFLDNTYNIVDFGAKSGAQFNNANAIRDAIQKCNSAGGGRVVVPSGRYFTGPIHLLSNVNLHLEDGAELLFSTNPADFPIVHTSFEGIELMNYSPLIYAYKQNNIAISGNGVLNGQASSDNWWSWKGSKDYGWQEGLPSQMDSLSLPRLMSLSDKNIPVEERVFGHGHYMRPTFIEPLECTNVMIRDVKIINAPFWIIHPIKSKYVTIDGVSIDSHGPNNDGCDPEYCENVIIRNTTFNTGDDCIAIKAGRDADGRRVAMKSQNIVVQNCRMIDGHGGVVIGSEASGGVANVYVEDCVMSSPNLDRAIRIKTNTKRGGIIENIYVRNLEVGEVREALLKVNMHYATYNNQVGKYMPTVRNIYFENVNVNDGGKFGILANGYAESPIENISFRNVQIQKAKNNYSLKHVKQIEFVDTYINGALIQDVNY